MIFMILMTAYGVLGGLLGHGYVAVWVYYMFALLRPQFLWPWALPLGTTWSLYPALASLVAIGVTRVRRPGFVFHWPHLTMVFFLFWMLMSSLNAYNRDIAFNWLWESFKLILMYLVAAYFVQNTKQLWNLYILGVCCLGFIAYEINYQYLINRYIGIWRNGFGGYDNNGAGLLLTMGVPLAFFAFEATRSWVRWFYLALMPILAHAMLLTFSRGAMVSLILAWVVVIVRSRYRFSLAALTVLFCVTALPIVAGKEIQDRFFTISKSEVDESANSRRMSWQAAWKMSLDYPLFGVGVRNSNLFSYSYGADMPGRTIHNQYLQVLADTGFPGLFFYSLILLGFWISTIRGTWASYEPGVDADTAEQLSRLRAIIGGSQASMIAFSMSAIFLSLETFELTYFVILLGVQGQILVSDLVNEHRYNLQYINEHDLLIDREVA
jgi:probable O-glycosylation ligase (exosortase A-associated)